MSKIVNPTWYKDKIEYFREHGALDITVDFNKAAQAIIIFLSSKNVPFRVYSLGAGVKRITTETKKCPCCKHGFGGGPAMVDKKDAWTDCVEWDDRPKTLSDGLKILADWFDAAYDDDGVVQADLRKWAADYEALEAKLAAAINDGKIVQAERDASINGSIETVGELLDVKAKLDRLVEAIENYRILNHYSYGRSKSIETINADIELRAAIEAAENKPGCKQIQS